MLKELSKSKAVMSRTAFTFFFFFFLKGGGGVLLKKNSTFNTLQKYGIAAE